MFSSQFHSNFLVLLFVIFSCVVVSLADQRQKIVDFHTDCLDIHGVDEEALISALDGDVPQDDAFYEHLFCAAKKANIMDDAGNVNLDNFEKDLAHVIDPPNMPRVAAILRKCVIQKDDIMSTIKDAVDCFVKEDHGL